MERLSKYAVQSTDIKSNSYNQHYLFYIVQVAIASALLQLLLTLSLLSDCYEPIACRIAILN